MARAPWPPSAPGTAMREPTSGRLQRTYGNEQWTPDTAGLMRRPAASVNDTAITETQPSSNNRRVLIPRIIPNLPALAYSGPTPHARQLGERRVAVWYHA